MSKIEWTDKTLNPFVGCTKISPACDECYALKMAYRLKRMYKSNGNKSLEKYFYVVSDDKKWNNGVSWIDESVLDRKKLGKKGNKIFIGSMTDLFHPAVDEQWLDIIFQFVIDNPDHIFQILTKRPVRMKQYFDAYYAMHTKFSAKKPIPNLWVGVTVENQQYADDRIPLLLETPAAIRFISCEPLLGRIDFSSEFHSYLTGFTTTMSGAGGGIPFETHISTNKLDWVIIGGETGHKARPMHPDWLIGMVYECIDSNVPVFFKSWGEWHNGSYFGRKYKQLYVLNNGLTCDPKDSICRDRMPTEEWNELRAHVMTKTGKKLSGNKIDKVEYLEFPNVNN